jgi:peptidoglycan/xylan/chitin deacetylase (PgdA/CDA1 family)
MARDKLSVFVFHKVPNNKDPLAPGDLDLKAFQRTLTFIAEHFNVVPLDEALKKMKSRTLGERTASITFDDGYQDWEAGAVPVLENLGLHATFFITTGQFDGVPMWHERILHALRFTPLAELSLKESGLPTLATESLAQRAQAAVCIERHLKYQALSFRDEMLAQLEEVTGASHQVIPTMSAAQLRNLSNRGFGIGAHTVNHPILRYSDSDSVKYELGAAKDMLENMISQKVSGFAYPNGRPSVDFSPLTIRLVKEAGYDYAVTTDWGVADVDTSVFQVPRFTPWGPDRFRMQVQIVRNLRTQPVLLPE